MSGHTTPPWGRDGTSLRLDGARESGRESPLTHFQQTPNRGSSRQKHPLQTSTTSDDAFVADPTRLTTMESEVNAPAFCYHSHGITCSVLLVMVLAGGWGGDVLGRGTGAEERHYLG